MVFQSYVFLLLFLIALLGYYLLGRLGAARGQRLWLLAVCLVFYGWGAPKGLVLLLLECAFSYLLGRAILRLPQRRKLLLAVGAAGLLAVLLRFKYASFFLSNLNALTGQTHTLTALALPLGLSFLTFQQLLYLRDCAAGNAPRLSPLDYALFLCLFCTVSSGPITRAGEMTPQLHPIQARRFDWGNLSAGLYCFSLGLFKKVLIADTFAGAVTYGWDNLATLTTPTAAFAMLAYTFQLYFDFSGYCDMAAGLAKMLGLSLPVNFDSPYRAVSVGDFWKRWHITLSRFFRLCIYIPLGGNRKGTPRTCLNIFLIYLISGLWHGAGWTFLLWGALHGAAMVLDRLFRGKVRLPKFFGWLFTFIFVNITWVYFRAPSLAAGNQMLSRLFSLSFALPDAGFTGSLLLPEFTTLLNLLAASLPRLAHLLTRGLPLLLFPLALALTLLVQNPVRQMQEFKPTAKKALVSVAALCWSVVSLANVGTFLYVNF